MPQAKDEAGNIWEVDAQGNALRLVTPAGGGRIFNLAPSPEKQRAEARADTSDARAATAAENAAKAAARADLEWKAKHNADGSDKTAPEKAAPVPPSAIKDLQENIKALRAVDTAIQLLDKRPGSIGFGTGALGDRFTQWHDPDGTKVRAALGAVGAFKIHDLSGAAVSASEAPRFTPFVPAVTDTPDVAKQKLESFKNELHGQINEWSQAYSTTNGFRPFSTPELDSIIGNHPAEQHAGNEAANASAAASTAGNGSTNSGNTGYGKPATPFDDPSNSGGNAQVIATGLDREVPDERIGSMLNSLYNAGASKAMIDEALKPLGAQPVDPKQYAAARAWMKANPGKAYNGGYAVRHEPLSLLQRGAGSALGAGVAQYANAATAGTVGALAGEQGKGALDAMRAAHPDLSAAGDIVGGITGAGALELGAAKALAPSLARFAPRIADATYGAVTGATSANEGEGLQGAVIGGATGLAGGYLGERAMHAAASATRGVTNPIVQRLRDAGIPLTVGQTVEGSGRVGEMIKGIEDRMTGMPIVGSMVNARRTEGLEGFNQAAFERAAAPGASVTATGAQGVGQLRQGVGDAYSRALDPVTIDTLSDPQLLTDLAQARVSAGAMQNPAPTFPRDFAEGSLQNRFDGYTDPNGQISGRNFQEAYRGLGRDARGRSASDSGYEIGQVLRQGQDTLGEALERQNPGAFTGFVEANAANRRLNVLADAVDKAKNQGDELFTPAQLNRADATSTSRLEGKINSAAGNRPFYDLAMDGQAVLPSQVPDSGTAGRMMTGLALSGMAGAGGAGGYAMGGGEGAATGTGLGLGTAIALALGGTRGAQNVATRMLMDRPNFAVPVAEEIERRARLGGLGLGAYLSNAVSGP